MLEKNIVSLKKYKLEEKIASGNFGTVYKAKEKRTGIIVAAKLINDELSENESVLKNFKREVSIISRIKHPAVLNFIGISMTNFDGENKPVIFTDYLPNGSLMDILKQSEKGYPPKEWDDTKKLINIYGIAAAMTFLHSNQILHRDLKPANILMDKSFHPIIADFGISKDKRMISSNTLDGIGTPAYMAPEIWLDSIYSKEGDVYAFAFIVYEIIANKDPFVIFQNMSLFQIIQAICNGERPDTSFIEEPYKTLIEKCWSKNALDRPTFRYIMNDLSKNKKYRKDTIDNAQYDNYIKYIKKSPQDFISIIDPKYENVIDIVFLIDGLKTNKIFKKSIKESFKLIATNCISEYPKTYFQFGVVVYYDLIASYKTPTMKHKFYPHFLELTDSLEEVQNFLDKIKLNSIPTLDKGYYYTNDLASGYHAILNRIRWDKNSEKIVIHLCNSPTYGKYYTIDPQNTDLMKIPQFMPKTNFEKNEEIYNDIQTKQNNWLSFLIRSLVDEGVKLYCLNNNEINIFCLKEIKKKYDDVGGQKFLIKNIFDQNNYFNEQLTQFALNIIKSLSNKSHQEKFELEINEQFQIDCDKYLFPKYDYLNIIAKLKDEISTAKSLIHDQINSIQNTSNIPICDMVKQTLQKYNELSTLVGQIKQPTVKNNNNKEEIEQLNEKIQNIKGQKSILSEYCNKLKLENQNSKEKNKSMKSQIQELQEEIQSIKIENSTVTNKFNEVQTENKCLHDQIGELKNMMDQYKNDIIKLKDQNTELHGKYYKYKQILKKIAKRNIGCSESS